MLLNHLIRKILLKINCLSSLSLPNTLRPWRLLDNWQCQLMPLTAFQPDQIRAIRQIRQQADRLLTSLPDFLPPFQGLPGDG